MPGCCAAGPPGWFAGELPKGLPPDPDPNGTDTVAPFHTSCSKSHVLILPEHELFNHNNVENHAMSQLLFCIRSDTTAYARPFLAILTRQGTAK